MPSTPQANGLRGRLTVFWDKAQGKMRSRSRGPGNRSVQGTTEIHQGRSDNNQPPSGPKEHSELTALPTCWDIALGELTEKQRKVLDNFGAKNIQTFSEEVELVRKLGDGCTNKLFKGKQDGARIMTRGRVYRILRKMEQFAAIGDIAVKQSPDQAVSLVWTGIRLCLQVVLNDMQTFEAVSSALDDIAGMMGSCKIYERIHSSRQLDSSKAVMEQLPQAYAEVLKFMAEAIYYADETYIVRLGKGLFDPFQTRFGPLLGGINSSNRELERRARVGNDELQHEMNEDQKREFKELSDQLSYFRGDILSVSRDVSKLWAHVDGTKRHYVLGWISTVDFGAHHERTKKLRFEGTGEWLFGKRSFENWVEAESSSMMWLSGKPGSGKTVLSSLVVDTVVETYKSVPVLYFYCFYGENERIIAAEIIKSLLKQLYTVCDELDPVMVKAFDNHTSLTTEVSEGLFRTGLSQFEKVFIVLDALDECSEGERRSIVELLTRQLQSGGCQVKIFLTSRPEEDLKRLLGEKLNHHISADDTLKDIKPYVTAMIDDHIRNRRLLDGEVTPKLREDAIQMINDGADGMFLWVKLQLNLICEQANERGVRKQLMELPDDLYGLYDRIWTKIQSQGAKREWALKALKWILYAERPLSPQEILQATAIQPQSLTLDEADMASDISYLIRVCGNLIALDEETGVLRFVHYSVHEFLKKKKEDFKPDEDQSFIGEVCFAVLGLKNGSNFERSHTGIYRYAAQNWVAHCRFWTKTNARRETLIQEFLLDEKYFMMWRENRGRTWLRDRDKVRFYSSPYHTAVNCNIPVILRYLLERKPYDGSDRLLLETVAASCHVGLVQVLIDAGADVNAQGGQYGSALRAAVVKDSTEVVKLLLDAGDNFSAQGGVYGSVLQTAVVNGSEEVVKLLLDTGADVNAQGGYYGSALQAAVAKGSTEVVKLLLDAGADVNTQDGEYGSALQAAVAKGSTEIVKLLLDAGADVNTQDGEYGSTLQAAVAKGSTEVVKLLLDAGANVNAQAGFALLTAAARGSAEAVKLLLDAGAGVNAQAGSALQAAAAQGSAKVVKLLLDAGADVNAQGGYYGSALQATAFKGSAEVVKLLLDAGANVNAQGGVYESALQAAAAKGSTEVAKLLLGAGADVNSQGGEYGSALQAAVAKGSTEVVKLLLHAGADVNTQGEMYEPALQATAFDGSEKFMKMLLDAGAKAQDGRYGSPLRVSKRLYNKKIEALLWEHGATD